MALSNPIPQYLTAAVTSIGVVGSAYLAYRLYQEKKNRLPEEWRQVGHLKRLYVYPVKSCAPIILNQGECTNLGMRDGWLRDRVLMIVDAKDNNFATAREYPELVTVQPSIKKAILILQHPNMETIEVNLAEVIVTQKTLRATVWGANVPAYDCGEEVNKWFTKFLNRKDTSFRLVYYASQKCRPLLLPKVFYKCRKTDTGMFPDQLSFNLINESSLNDLNTRLKDVQVNETYFRPNFLLSGDVAAYDEDNWEYLKIGENIFEVVKPCTRCIMTTVDPETGMRNKATEPLQTLRSYRLVEDPRIRKATGMHPRMGVQMALRSGGGNISVGDPIYVA